MMKHGGNITEAAARFGFQPDEMIDLSTGISPRSFSVDLSVVTAERLRALPQEIDIEAVKNLMRKRWDVPDSAKIALAPGSGLLINLIPRLRVPRLGSAGGLKSVVAMPDPVYSEHAAAWQAEGHRLIRYEASGLPAYNPSGLPAYNPSGLPAHNHGDIIVAVQPGNPKGNCLAPDDWAVVLDHILSPSSKAGLVVVDEAFIDLMPEKSLMRFAGRKGLIILRSLGKFYGLAGLRLGAAIGHDDDIARLDEMMGPWAVSTVALDLAMQVLADLHWADEQRLWLAAQGAALRDVLTRAGLDIIGGTDLYCLVDAGAEAAACHHHLAKQGIWTRIFEERPTWIRFGLPKDDHDRARLAAAL
jgi:cobalamin biosynthetic protein CobC